MQEDKREYDDTIVTKNDDEVYADEQDDEFEPYFSHKITPKIMITTGERPCKEAILFVSELMGMIPNAYYYERSICYDSHVQASRREGVHALDCCWRDAQEGQLVVVSF